MLACVRGPAQTGKLVYSQKSRQTAHKNVLLNIKCIFLLLAYIHSRAAPVAMVAINKKNKKIAGSWEYFTGSTADFRVLELNAVMVMFTTKICQKHLSAQHLLPLLLLLLLLLPIQTSGRKNGREPASPIMRRDKRVYGDDSRGGENRDLLVNSPLCTEFN